MSMGKSEYEHLQFCEDLNFVALEELLRNGGNDEMINFEDNNNNNTSNQDVMLSCMCFI